MNGYRITPDAIEDAWTGRSTEPAALRAAAADLLAHRRARRALAAHEARNLLRTMRTLTDADRRKVAAFGLKILRGIQQRHRATDRVTLPAIRAERAEARRRIALYRNPPRELAIRWEWEPCGLQDARYEAHCGDVALEHILTTAIAMLTKKAA